MTEEEIQNHNEEFRSIISHAFLGCDTSDISKETWDLAINECVKYLSIVAKKEAIEFGNFLGKEDLKMYSEGWCQLGGSNGLHLSTDDLYTIYNDQKTK